MGPSRNRIWIVVLIVLVGLIGIASFVMRDSNAPDRPGSGSPHAIDQNQ